MQYHYSIYQGLPDTPGDTRVKIMTKMSKNCLLYYYGLKLSWYKIRIDLDEYDGPNPKHNDKVLVTIFDAILKR